MTEDFNKWWDSDELDEDNPYTRDTPAFWAWEGWQAGAAAEREACAKVCDVLADKHTFEGGYANECAIAIRARGKNERH